MDGDGRRTIGLERMSCDDARRYAESIIDSLREALIVLDDSLRVVSANRSFYRRFHVSEQETEGRLIYELGNRQWDIPALRHLLEAIIPRHESFEDFEVRHRFERIGERVMLLNARRVGLANGKPGLILLAIEDVTELHAIRGELEEKSATLDALLDFIPESIMITDENHVLKSISRYSGTLFGIPPEKLLGSDEPSRLHVLNLFDPDGKRKVHPGELPLSKAAITGERYTDYELVVKRDGAAKILSASAAPVRNSTGAVVGAVGTWRDVTEQRKQARETQRRRRLLEQILDDVPVGIALLEGAEFVTTVANRAYNDFAYGRGEVRGRAVVQVWPDMADRIIPLLERVYETGEPYHATDAPFTINRGKGPEKAWFSFSYLPFYGEDEKVTGILVWSFETTFYVRARRELERALEQLRTERELLETIFNTIPVMLTLSTPDTMHFEVNRHFERVSGWSNEQMQAPDAMEKVYPDPGYREEVRKYMHSLAPGYKDLRIRCRDGTVKETTWSNVRIPDGRQVGIGIDITDRKRTERALRESEEKFRAIFEQAAVGIGRVSFHDARWIDVNAAFCTMLGYSEEEFKATPWPHITHPDDVDRDLIPFKRMAAGKLDSYSVEKRFMHTKGNFVWARLTLSLVRDERNRPDYEIAIIENITERKQAEEALRHKTAQLEATIDSLPDGYIVYNRDGTIRRINAVARQILGYTEQEHRLPDEQRMARLRIETSAGEPFPHEWIPSRRALVHGETNRDVVMRIQGRDRAHWLSVSAAPIGDPEGGIHGAVMEFTDITRQHELQEQLAGERNFVDAILQTSGALIAVLTSDGRFVRFNRECEQLTGYSAEEAGSLSVLDQLIPPEERAGVEGVMARLFAGESLVEHENHWVSRTGRKRFIRWRNTALRDEEGGIVFAIATGIDITDRKRLEEELDRRARELETVNRELESFSYSVSHDLRNPLTAIGSLATFLQEDYAERLDEEGREFLRRIDAGIKKMQRLIESLLSLSRIGRQEMAREEVDLSTMVRDVLRELGDMQPERRADWVIQEAVHADADPRLIAVALENLLRNAWKFTARREMAVIEFGTSERDGERVFYVRDNGVGFDARFARRIFEPFKRVHHEREFGGTGVGLSIVQRVISRHGGRVWATGEVDKGATFYFTLG